MTLIDNESATDLVAGARRTLGPVGFHLPYVGQVPRPHMATQQKAITQLEQAGYRTAWAGEGVGGKDIFTEVAVLLAATEQMSFGTGVANMWARPAETASGAARTIVEAFPGRFVLGMGAGYPFQAESLGYEYSKPLSRLRGYVEKIKSSDRSNPGYATIIAANGPKSIDAAGEVADGAHPTVVAPDFTALARKTLGPDKLLAVGLTIFPDKDEQRAKAAAQQMFAAVMSTPGSPYLRNLIRCGYSEDEVMSGSERVLDSVLAYGSATAIADKIHEHLEAGADHVVLTPVSGSYESGVEQLLSTASMLDDPRLAPLTHGHCTGHLRRRR